MIEFILILLVTAFAQIIGGVLSWFAVKKFSKNIKSIILMEIILMLLVSVLLIFEGLQISLLTIISIIAGITVLHIFNKIIPHKHHHENKQDKICSLVFIAMCFHEFPEGIAFGSAYLVNPLLGIATGILIALHNLPEGSIITIPYFAKGKFWKGMVYVTVTQILYVIGALLSYFLLINISEIVQAMAMTFAAGAMLYIIWEEFLYLKQK